jgi:apolipoprotein D and lipocalin family protein
LNKNNFIRRSASRIRSLLLPKSRWGRVAMGGAVFTLVLMFGFFGCGSEKNLPVVNSVDLTKYAGKWYEIASFPQSFQKGCSCTTAEYTVMANGNVEVKNNCIKEGKVKGITGKAFAVKGSNNAKLKVQFFWPLRGDYYIIDLAPDYSYALVGHPNRDYLWVLSRTPKMDEAVYAQLLKKATELEFDTSRLVKTVQSCN